MTSARTLARGVFVYNRPEGSPLSRLDAALSSFAADDAAPRVIGALAAVVPGSAAVAGYRSLAEAAAVLHPGAPEGLVERAQALAEEAGPRNALLVGESLDSGDKGVVLKSGLFTALSSVLGTSWGSAQGQQRSDAAVKVLGLCAIADRLVGDLGGVRTLDELPSGSLLVAVLGTVEVAMPFQDALAAEAKATPEAPAAEAVGRFLAALWAAEAKGAADRVVPVVGKEAGERASADIPHALPLLAGRIGGMVGQMDAVLGTVTGYLPGFVGAAGNNLPELAATAADALFLYGWLVPRVVAEACLARARRELDPTWSFPHRQPAPAPTPSAPELEPELEPGPGPVGATNPFAAPFTAAPAAVAAATPTPSAPSPTNPFAAPFTAASAHREPEPEPVITPANVIDPAPEQLPSAHRDLAAVVQSAPRSSPPVEPTTSATSPTSTLIPAPASPPPRPTGPPREPLSGVWLCRDGSGDLWFHLTAEGALGTEPPRREAPAPPGRYDRRGGRLRVWLEGGAFFEVPVKEGPRELEIDGRPMQRVDWDLTGRRLEGTWTGTSGTWSFLPDQTFERSDGRRGWYSLGRSAVALRNHDGSDEVYGFLSDLAPSAESPERLWLDGSPLIRKML